jgi:hypothetical protein
VQEEPHRRDLPVLAAAIGVSALGCVARYARVRTRAAPVEV